MVNADLSHQGRIGGHWCAYSIACAKSMGNSLRLSIALEPLSGLLPGLSNSLIPAASTEGATKSQAGGEVAAEPNGVLRSLAVILLGCEEPCDLSQSISSPHISIKSLSRKVVISN